MEHGVHKATFYEKYVKRMLDVLIAGAAILLLSWLMAAVAIAVRIVIGKPVLFKHPRPGKNEKIFCVCKFRTMTNDTGPDGKLLPDKDRLIPFGKFLRSTSLDELPELFLILTGKMSLVGPRPLEVYFLPYYTEREHHRHDVTPGLTGLAQVNGRNNIRWEEKFAYDLEYIENMSFVLDLKIVLKTILKVLRRSDVVEEGGAAIRDFNEVRQEEWAAARREKK